MERDRERSPLSLTCEPAPRLVIKKIGRIVVFVEGESRSLLFPRSFQAPPMNRFFELPAPAKSIQSEALKFPCIGDPVRNPTPSSPSEREIHFLDYNFSLSISFFSDIRRPFVRMQLINFEFEPGRVIMMQISSLRTKKHLSRQVQNYFYVFT